MSDNHVIGIDLGTTYSCVAVWQNGRVEIIPNELGERTTPSVVAFNSKERLIGSAAINANSIKPSNIIHDIKRIIGRKFNDKSVQEDIKRFAFKVGSGDKNTPTVIVDYMDEEKHFRPEEISAMVLSKMKETAERYLGTKVTDCVVTVPAYFGDNERNATRNAATIAGLNILRLISEPTAASIAYGLDKLDGKKEHLILCFDFGGGTLDLSLISIDEGIFEVKATNGIPTLGGIDIDNTMVEYILNDIRKQYTRDIVNDRAKRRIRSACENAKRRLSYNDTARIELEELEEGFDYSYSFTRAKFDDICSDIFKQAMKPIERVLEDANVRKEEIDEIVLIGGSSRVPKIQQLLKEYFGKELNSSINPDECVAYGAAVQGAILGGNTDNVLSEIILVDVCPLSLGVETTGGIMTKVINRNTPLPIRKTMKFSTTADHQLKVLIQVYEGERTLTRHCNLLGKFELSDLPKVARGIPQIEIVFNVDMNGILRVTATEQSTGVSKDVTITNERSSLDETEINRMIEEAETYSEQDTLLREKHEAKNKLENAIYTMRNTANGEHISPQTKDKLMKLCTDAYLWVLESEDRTKEEYIEKYEIIKSELYNTPVVEVKDEELKSL